MKHKGFFILTAILAGTIGWMPVVSADQQAEIILKALINKGIITQADIDRAASEVATQPSTSVNVSQDIEERVSALEARQSRTPKWLDKVKLKGDFRLRYEHKERKGSNDVERGRVRYRLGIEAKIVDQVRVGAGLASGSDSSTSARSTNQDLQDVFSTKPFSLDYAFVEYAPTDWSSVIAGKFKRKKYLWEPGDLLWDTDINPEGGSARATYDWTDEASLYANTGVWILDESTGDTSDPYLFYIQTGAKVKDEERGLDAQVAVTYYDFDNVKGTTLDGALGDNSADSGGGLLYKFTPIAIGAEAGIADPLDLPVARVAVFGEFVHNPDPDDENNGWLLGWKAGDKKVNDRNKWQLKYIFARLEKDAFLDVLPDADRYSGGTDIVSHEGIVQFGLNKNVMIELDYYHSNRVNAASRPENLFQTSANFKF